MPDGDFIAWLELAAILAVVFAFLVLLFRLDLKAIERKNRWLGIDKVHAAIRRQSWPIRLLVAAILLLFILGAFVAMFIHQRA